MIFNPGQFPTLEDLNRNFNISLPIRGIGLSPNSEVRFETCWIEENSSLCAIKI